MDESALNAIIENLYALYDGSESIEVAADSQRAEVLAHGWYTRVRRNGRALQVLTNAGFEHEGAPLRRSMIEHALGLHWLADAAEDAVDALLTGHRETWKKIAGSMTDGWPVTPEDLNPVFSIAIPKSSESTYLAFKHLCGRYDESDLYVAWLLETGQRRIPLSFCWREHATSDWEALARASIIARSPCVLRPRPTLRTRLAAPRSTCWKTGQGSRPRSSQARPQRFGDRGTEPLTNSDVQAMVRRSSSSV